jgi:hypothetical protein
MRRLHKRWYVWVSVLLFVAVPATVLITNRYLEHQFVSELQREINHDPDSAFNYYVDDAEIGLWAGRLVIRGLRLVPRDSYLDRVRSGELAVVAGFAVDQVVVRGASALRLFLANDLVVREIILRNPRFKYYGNPHVELARTRNPIGEIMATELGTARVGRIRVINGQVEIMDASRQDRVVLSIDSSDFDMRGVVADSATVRGLMPIQVEDVEARAGTIRFGGLEQYAMASEGLRYESRSGILEVTAVRFESRLDRDAYLATVSGAVPWLSARADTVRVRGIDFEALDRDGIIGLRALELSGARLDVAADVTEPADRTTAQPLPAAVIREIPIPFYLDSVYLRDLAIRYSERVDTGQDLAEISFLDTQGIVTNLTNAPERLAESPDATLNATTRLLGATSLQVDASFAIPDAAHSFAVNATLDSVPFSAFNQAAMAWAGVSFTKGSVLGIQLGFFANDSIALGFADFEYDAIGIDVHHMKKGERQWFASWLGNAALRSKNLKTEGRYIRGEIHYRRAETLPFFAYVWRSVRSGLVPVAVGDLLRGRVRKSLRRD